MLVLVTGATGFIGSSLCRALVDAGYRVRALHRASSRLDALEGLPVEHVLGDVLDPLSLLQALRGVEAVLHTAAQMGAWRDADAARRSHVEGTRHVVAAALQAGVRRMVHTSSVAALGVSRPRPDGTWPLIDETHSWNYQPARWPYGYAKHLAEREVQLGVSRGLEAVIVNPALVVGPGDVYRRSGALLALVAHSRWLPSVPAGLNVVHADDVAAGHLAAMEHGRPGEQYILGGENLTVDRLLATTAEVLGRRPPRVMIPAWALRAAAAPLGLVRRALPLPIAPELLHLAGSYLYYDTHKAQTELGLTAPKPYRQAVEDALAWYRGHGGL
jgi:dihydroflavonol-4-reductase